MQQTAIRVHKFGGTSMGDAARIRRVADIVLAEPDQRVVVVSAMGGVTNALYELLNLAVARADWRGALGNLVVRHIESAAELLDGAESLRQRFVDEGAAIAEVLTAIERTRARSEPLDEWVVGHGELWSAALLAAHLKYRGQAASAVDARELIVVQKTQGSRLVIWARSEEQLRILRGRIPAADLWVVTGFVASTEQGVATTLLRNGSDWSAAIVGRLMQASEVVIWTDVDGVLSADPRRVPEAVVVPSLSYEEASELASFGAKVVHPQTMVPCVEAGIPIRVKNTLRPSLPGSRIAPLVRATTDAPVNVNVNDGVDEDGTIGAATHKPNAGRASGAVTGFSTLDHVALLDLQGPGLIGVVGMAERVFGCLSRAGINVNFISQASSERSICIGVHDVDADRAQAVLQEAFATELRRGEVQGVELTRAQSILAAVGDGMINQVGVAARFFQALADVNVSIRAIAQGSSERNVSVVVDARDATRALRAVHAAFTLSKLVLNVGLIGPGLIGATVLQQMKQQAAELGERRQLEIRVRGITSSKRMLLDDDGIDLDTWQERFAREAVDADLEAFAAHIRPSHLPHAVVVDCTASDVVADHYASFVSRGLHVVTPNKRAGSGPLRRWQKIQNEARRRRVQVLTEATVGAGLPIFTTLRDLLETGDTVRSIEGVLSGTLAFLFNTVTPDAPWSTAVRDARTQGFTEPDPRDDLSGTDVARKLVALAREVGRPLELADVEVESLVPASLSSPDLSADAFLDGLSTMDGEMQARLAKAAANHQVLRYVARLDANGRATVGLASLPESHPFAATKGTDNVIAFTTDRYPERPLVVQGAGAGPAVTAAGVFGDLLRLATSLRH